MVNSAFLTERGMLGIAKRSLCAEVPYPKRSCASAFMWDRLYLLTFGIPEGPEV
jgi:hypothetical protein